MTNFGFFLFFFILFAGGTPPAHSEAGPESPSSVLGQETPPIPESEESPLPELELKMDEGEVKDPSAVELEQEPGFEIRTSTERIQEESVTIDPEESVSDDQFEEPIKLQIPQVAARFLKCFDPKNPVHQKHPPVCYQLRHSAHVRITIFSSEGDRVRLLRDKDRRAGVDTVWWDRKNDYGELVPAGIYTVVLEVAGHKLEQDIVVSK